MTDLDALIERLENPQMGDDWGRLTTEAADAIHDLLKQDEIHWKTRNSLLAELNALREALKVARGLIATIGPTYLQKDLGVDLLKIDADFAAQEQGK